MKDQRTKVVATRITINLAKLIEDHCKGDSHVNTADFVRDAIREKLQRDAPEHYHKLLREGKE